MEKDAFSFCSNIYIYIYIEYQRVFGDATAMAEGGGVRVYGFRRQGEGENNEENDKGVAVL